MNFTVAVSRRTKDEATGQWKDADTSFLRCNAWRSMAENIAESLTRGSRVVVVGRIRQRTWETPEGDKRSAVEIEADEVGPSLRWATTKVEQPVQGRRRVGLGRQRLGRRRWPRRGDSARRPITTGGTFGEG